MVNVSVVLPIFNGEKFLSDCVHSILSQSYQDFNLIVVDDGSTDGSTALIRAINDPRIEYHLIAHGGTVEARKFGISRATGTWVAFCDQDDRWLPEKLEKQMADVKGYDLIHSDAYLLKDGHREGTYWDSIHSVPSRGGKELLPQFFLRNQINNSSVMVRRELVVSALDIPLASDICLDIDYSLWLEMLWQGARFTYIEEPLIEYRVHAHQQTFSRYRSRQWQSYVIKEFLKRHPDMWKIHPFLVPAKLLKTEMGLAFSKIFQFLE